MIEFLVLALALAAQDAEPAGDVTALTGATVIDGTGQSFENATVIVEGGEISCAGPAEACPVPEGAETLDLQGRFITPGLVDAHVHYAQTGWLDGRPDGVPAPAAFPYAETEALLRANQAPWDRAFLCSGVTATFDVGGPPWTVGAAHLRDGLTSAPHRAAAGPLVTHGVQEELNLPGQPTFLPFNSDGEARESIERVAGMNTAALKIWYLEPSEDERETLDARLMAAGEQADAAGLPLIVHATGLREAKMALRAGAEMLVHGVFDQPVDQEFLDLLTESGAAYVPTMHAGPNWTRAIAAAVTQDAPELDDPNDCITEFTRQRIGELEEWANPREGLDADWAESALAGIGGEIALYQQNLKAVYEAGGFIATGTDAGNPLTVHGPSIYEEMETMQAAGLAPMDVIIMSTLNGARAMGRAEQFGSLEAGKAADLLVLAEDPRKNVAAFRSLTHVMRGGELIEQEELQAE